MGSVFRADQGPRRTANSGAWFANWPLCARSPLGESTERTRTRMPRPAGLRSPPVPDSSFVPVCWEGARNDYPLFISTPGCRSASHSGALVADPHPRVLHSQKCKHLGNRRRCGLGDHTDTVGRLHRRSKRAQRDDSLGWERVCFLGQLAGGAGVHMQPPVRLRSHNPGIYFRHASATASCPSREVQVRRPEVCEHQLCISASKPAHK